MFSTLSKTEVIILGTFKLLSPTAFKLDLPKMLSFGRELRKNLEDICYQIIKFQDFNLQMTTLLWLNRVDLSANRKKIWYKEKMFGSPFPTLFSDFSIIERVDQLTILWGPYYKPIATTRVTNAEFQKLFNLSLSQTSPGFYVSASQVFRKHFGKRRNCL